MELTAEFWNHQQGLMLIGTDGSLRFTPAGRARYAPLFAKYGLALQNVTTRDDFIDKMQLVQAGEFDVKLAENTRQFEELLKDPSTSLEERALIRRVLGYT
jgi:hypothetical protein